MKRAADHELACSCAICALPAGRGRRSAQPFGDAQRLGDVAQDPVPAARGWPRAGFTVLELLVAASITLLLAGLAAGVVRNLGASWRRASGRLGAHAQARVVLDQLQFDLQGALYRDDGNVWFAADVLDHAAGDATGLWQPAANPKPPGGLSLQMTSARMADARFGIAGVWLRFFTTSRGANREGGRSSSGTPVAVGYQIIRRATGSNPAGGPTAYLLHRAEVRPAAATLAGGVRPGVLESGYDITGAAYTGAATAANDGGVTGDPRGIVTPGSDQGTFYNLDSVIADHVIDFGVRCHVRDAHAPGGLRLVFPARDAFGQPANDAVVQLRGRLPASTPPGAANYDWVFPEVVDVMIRVLTAEGATRLAQLEDGEGQMASAKYNRDLQEWWWGIALEYSHVYTRRIVIRAAPL